MSEIDVSKCCYYNADNSPFCCELYDNECEAQYCYFQQLQQLKAYIKEDLAPTCQRLQQENEELNKALDEKHSTKKCWLNFNGGVVDNLLCKNAVKNLMFEVEQLKAENEELKKCVKDIANYRTNGCDMNKCVDDDHFQDYCTHQCTCYLIQHAQECLKIIGE